MTPVITKPPSPARTVLPKTISLSAFDLAEFRRRAPLTVARFASSPQREAWLRRIWELETNWQEAMEREQKAAHAPEVIVRGAPPLSAEIEETFDVIYAGGALGLLHAVAVACGAHPRRVLV